MSLQMQHFYEFGVFCLDPVGRRLLREGKVVQLAPKAFDTLVALAEGGGQVLGRDELINRIWPDSDVSEANLAVMISSLRKALGERPDGGLYIETVPKQGYRLAIRVKESVVQPAGVEGENSNPVKQLVETVSPPSGASLTPGEVAKLTSVSGTGKDPETHTVTSTGRFTGATWFASHQIAVTIAVFIAVVTGAVYIFVLIPTRGERKNLPPRYLAILPFTNLKPDNETDFLGSSLAEATTTKLRYVDSLVVRPSAYVEKYRGQPVDPQKAADELRVDTLMTGTYIKEGNTLAVTVQLIDVNKGVILSKFPLETKFDKLITVQDQVAQNIIDQLHLKLTDSEAEHLKQKGTENERAYKFFLRGTDLYLRNKFLESVIMLETAVEDDPNFALAWAHLGRSYGAVATFNLKGHTHHLKAQDAYERALALSPDLIEATVFKANLLTDTNRVEQAVPLLRNLLESNANIAEAHWELGYAYRFAGMLKDSIDECARARALDPNVKLSSSAFNSYLYTGQYQNFLNSLPASDETEFVVFYRGFGNYYLKNFEQAALDFDRAYAMQPQLYNRVGKALSYLIKNEKPLALDILRDVDREIEQSGSGDGEGIYKVAQAYAVLGDKEAALRVLRRSIEKGFFCYDYFKSDPLLASLHSEPTFDELMKLALNRHEQFKQTFF
jgi:DNA-binding winged helix-turn-helix (wHTH) protein/TolB-like protein